MSIFSRASEQDLGTKREILLAIWILANLVVNTILLPILVITFLWSRRAKRHPTLVNVCMTWILSGIFSLLLFYVNQHTSNSPQPNKALCITQTSLLHGITPMWSVALLMLVYHMNLAFEGNIGSEKRMKIRMIIMLVAPYIALLTFFVATLIVSLARPDKVTRRHLHCDIDFQPLSNAMGIFTLVICFIITCFEARLGMTIYRNWRGFRNARRLNGTEIPLLLRALIFGIFVFFGMIVNAVSIFDSRSPFPDVFSATIGTVVFIVFASQSDVIDVWCFWRRNRPPPLALSPGLSIGSLDVKSAHPALSSAGFGFGEAIHVDHGDDDDNDDDDNADYVVKDGELVRREGLSVAVDVDLEKSMYLADVKVSPVDAEKRARECFVLPKQLTPPPPAASRA